MHTILVVSNNQDEKFLRTKTVPFDFGTTSPKEIRTLVQRMRGEMEQANGIGLSANQIGLPYRVFVAQVPDENGRQKFYALFNARIEKPSKEMETYEEGCLSIPKEYGPVPRHYKLTLVGQDMRGKKVRIKAWGLLARVFQHEIDHLDGTLFIDRVSHGKTKEVSKK